jgi:NADPH-dependent curcumin reductase
MAAATQVNRQWRLKSRPTGLIKADNFELVSQPMPVPEEAQILIRNVYLSLDPAMRGWLIDRPSYVPPVQIGEIMRGLAIGIVEKSNHPKFAAGDRVQGMFGWQEYVLSNGEAVMKLPENGLPLSACLGLFGLAGLTAYAGLLEVGQPKGGETLLISGAAGSVGSLVGQIGKIKGLRVVGIAGTDEKCNWLREELAFDAAVNDKDDNYKKQLKAACATRSGYLFRERRWRNLGERALPHEHLWSRGALRPDLAVQRHGTRSGTLQLCAGDQQAPQGPRFPRN